MTDDHDLDWIDQKRPVALLRPNAERDARRALERHMSGRPAPVRAVPAAPVRPPARVARRRRIVASAVLSAAAVTALLVATTGGGGSSPIGTPAADAAPLVRLSTSVRQSPPPTGDATLLVRHQRYPDRTGIDGYDLYADDGSYYYGATRAELAAGIADGPESGSAGIGRELAAAVAANSEPIDQARQQMAIAPLDPGTVAGVAAQAGAQRREQEILAKKQAAGAPPPTVLTPQQHTDGMIWSNSLDALLAGAGRPEVRAGVLTLLASVPEVTVAQTTGADGAPTLTLTSSVFPDGYQEQLVIDASDGTPISFTGGVPGKVPSVTIAYQVTRTTVAAVAAS